MLFEVTQQFVLHNKLKHHTGRVLTWDRSVNSFIMVVCVKNVVSCTVDRKFWPNFKKILIDNHYTILRSVRSERSSCRA